MRREGANQLAAPALPSLAMCLAIAKKKPDGSSAVQKVPEAGTLLSTDARISARRLPGKRSEKYNQHEGRSGSPAARTGVVLFAIRHRPPASVATASNTIMRVTESSTLRQRKQNRKLVRNRALK